ncbi:MAG: helical backbone metal receptor [Candidatus Cloacimonadota bacterium]|nr:helical backbone metal receptor [Candidatus Cloacimonadota bacterium]
MHKSLISFLLLLFMMSCTQNDSQIAGSDKKIVVLSPEIAEIICKIGGEENIVAVTRECDFPKSLKQKIQVGSFSRPNIEKIISLQPDIIMLSGLEQDIVKSNFEKLGTNIYQFYPANVDSLLSAIKKIGILVGEEKNAQNLVKEFKTNLARIPFREKKPTIYIEIYDKPIMTVSSESFIGNLIEKSGGENIFNQLPRDYCRISTERVIAQNPNIIFILYPGITKSDIANRLGWDKIDAVKNRQIYTTQDLNNNHFLRAGPRSLLAIEKIDSIIGNYHK